MKSIGDNRKSKYLRSNGNRGKFPEKINRFILDIKPIIDRYRKYNNAYYSSIRKLKAGVPQKIRLMHNMTKAEAASVL